MKELMCSMHGSCLLNQPHGCEGIDVQQWMTAACLTTAPAS